MPPNGYVMHHIFFVYASFPFSLILLLRARHRSVVIVLDQRDWFRRVWSQAQDHRRVQRCSRGLCFRLHVTQRFRIKAKVFVALHN